MRIKGGLTFNSQKIKTPEEFIEDLCDKINGFISKIRRMNQSELELMMLRGFIDAISNRKNRM
ncbi:MAG: hypothetical protein ACTSRI_17305 [Promethearchaeota archaeon]